MQQTPNISNHRCNFAAFQSGVSNSPVKEFWGWNADFSGKPRSPLPMERGGGVRQNHPQWSEKSNGIHKIILGTSLFVTFWAMPKSFKKNDF